MGTVLIPIPDRDFDPTEVAVSWQVLTGDGQRVVFSTESGAPACADDIMVTGRGLDFWSAIPVLRRASVVGRFLGANADARAAYAQMLQSAEYLHPTAWARRHIGRRRRAAIAGRAIAPAGCAATSTAQSCSDSWSMRSIAACWWAQSVTGCCWLRAA